jgi:hypothetical protein
MSTMAPSPTQAGTPIICQCIRVRFATLFHGMSMSSTHCARHGKSLGFSLGDKGALGVRPGGQRGAHGPDAPASA